MARENPRSWWLLSFFAVGLAQQVNALAQSAEKGGDGGEWGSKASAEERGAVVDATCLFVCSP